MGIFSSIKQKATQLSDFMQINTEIPKLELYYRNVENNLTKTVIIEDASQEVKNLLSKIWMYLSNYPLNKNDKYKSLSDKYPYVTSQAIQHNEKVERVLAAASAFQQIYDNALLKPNCYNRCHIYPYDNVYSEIKKDFTSYTPEILRFISEYEDLKFNIQEISRQYSIKDSAASLMVIGEKYIFAKEKDTLIRKLESYLPGTGVKHFYQFPSVKELIEKINDHNLHHLDEITSVVKPLYENILVDPYIQLDIELRLKYGSIVLDLESEYPAQSESLSHCYHSITEHIDEIRIQYDNYPKANKLLDIESQGYISLKNKQKIIDKLSSILPKETEYHYYNFPSVRDFEDKISSHNSGILNSAAYEFNDLYKSILKKPTDYDISIINKYSLMVEENEQSKEYRSKIIQNFVEQYHIINSNFGEIKRQYTAVLKLTSLINMDKLSFIDDKTAERILKQAEEYLPALGIDHFYQFPSIDQFRAEIIRHNEAFFRANPNIVYYPETDTLVKLTNAQLEIKSFLEKRNIKHLVHFTDSKNVESIKRHGILSVQQLMDRGMVFRRNDFGRYDNMLDYISLSITNPNLVLLSSYISKGTIDDVKVVIIDATILYKEINTPRIYCDRNAANGTCKKGSSIHHFENMFVETLEYQTPSTGKLYSYNRAIKRPNDTTDPQAEILFYRRIDPKYILDIK